MITAAGKNEQKTEKKKNENGGKAAFNIAVVELVSIAVMAIFGDNNYICRCLAACRGK